MHRMSKSADVDVDEDIRNQYLQMSMRMCAGHILAAAAAAAEDILC